MVEAGVGAGVGGDVARTGTGAGAGGDVTGMSAGAGVGRTSDCQAIDTGSKVVIALVENQPQ